MINQENYTRIAGELAAKKVQLIAVSKTRPAGDIRTLYDLGHRDFGENYVQELADKQGQLPGDIRWHFIGHLQSNKVKYIAPFIHLIQSVDSLKLLKEINKQAVKHDREIACLLQVHIAEEETKFGFDERELETLMASDRSELAALEHIRIAGLMGMASLSADENKIKSEFKKLKSLFDRFKELREANLQFTILSMGMSSDVDMAVREGSNMVRIGSFIFGERK
ncbi:MAG TPA: YggS family pyridoxal phosphate-dependent enzyme [Puia sp.]|nr:YggS family pyridoxal phosphate-dependent enzyme [Puia sp.]